MNKNVLNTGVQDYIRNFESSDILSVLFKKPLFEGLSNQELVQQLEGRQKCRYKLPLWFNTPGIYYPKKEAIEQSSSQRAALYKASLISGKSLLDLTGGFGVDSFHFSENFQTLVYCEKQKDLAEIASHNFKVLGADNIETFTEDGLEYLRGSDRVFDIIYLDPSRRTDSGKRVFQLEDMIPPLPESLSAIWQHTEQIVIKTSPLLDLRSGITLLGSVKEVHVVAIDNEVKELLWILEKEFNSEPRIIAVNLNSGMDEKFTFRPSEEREAVCSFNNPKNYIYEPNASLMKAGAFQLMSERFELFKLHQNSHLYTSDILINFPGRRYRVLQVIGYKSKFIKGLGLDKAHVISRNFPESVEAIRKKFKFKDGEESSLIFTTQADGAYICIHCERIAEKGAATNSGKAI